MRTPIRTGVHPWGSLALIAAAVSGLTAAFAYTAGWLTPERLTPDKLVTSLAPPDGPALGHRRNHAKGICFTGTFAANGAGTALSSASLFVSGDYPVVGRFNLGSPDFYVKDATARVRGMGLEIHGPSGSVWRMALIDLPFFPVATPAAFYELQVTSADKDPDAMKRFSGRHPEFLRFLGWAGTAPWTGSYAEERYNSLDTFTFVNSADTETVVRWSLVPVARAVPVPPGDLRKQGPDFLESEISERVEKGSVAWRMVVLAANPGDPLIDPSKAWTGEHRTVDVGALTVQRVEPEAAGPCRDINYDPTVLPRGIQTSNDPFPAARSSAYRRSYDLRTSERRYYPSTVLEKHP